MLGRVMFGVTVSNIFCAWGPIYMKLVLLDSFLNQIKPHIYCIGSDLSYVVVGNPAGSGIVNLYGGVGGCLGPISSRVMRPTPSLQFKKSAPTSASAAGGMAAQMILTSWWTGPFSGDGGGGGSWRVCSGRSFRWRGCKPQARADMRRRCGCGTPSHWLHTGWRRHWGAIHSS
jgi:hypothetical protein